MDIDEISTSSNKFSRTSQPKALKINLYVMKALFFLLSFISISVISCQNSDKKTTHTPIKNDSGVLSSKESKGDNIRTETNFALALSSNSLQIINQNTGSTNMVSFKTPIDQTIEIVEKVLKSKPTININRECGAGPLKMATWDNGLTLLFQKNKDTWLFVGWAANEAKNPKLKVNTMAGIGVGSNRKEMESAYVIKVSKTSLGYEFSTKSDDLFGIFDGADKNAKITNLWSGVSCNFR